MGTPRHKITAVLLLTSLMLQGCAVGPFELQYLWRHDDGLSYYVDKASGIEYPTDVHSDIEVTDPDIFVAPRNIRSLEDVEPREITLNECIRLALAETTVIRDDGSFNSPGNPILSRPAQVGSILDPAIQQTGFLFGNRGYEAALSDFDALFTTTATWGRDDVPQNSANLGLGAGDSLINETFAWQTSLEKTLADGSVMTLSGTTNYDANNRPVGPNLQQFASSYSGNVQAEFRKPLLAGAGSEFTRIAGPQSQNLRGVSGVSQGVLISRINGDISLTQFEESILTLVRDVEQKYWDLNLALRLYESEKDAFVQLNQYFQKLKDRNEGGVPILQTQARIFEADARLRGSLADVLDAEVRLRRLCHLPINDYTFLYPEDAPSEAEFSPLWEATLQDAFVHRVQLRRQKWEIKSLELQLQAARSLVRPRLDFVSQARMNGLGDRLIGDHDDRLDTLGGSITSGNHSGWSLGLQLSQPVGLRLARIQVRNYELRLRKARAVLVEQEREIAYELSGAVLNMQRWFELADSTTRRIETSRQHVEAAEEFVNANPNATSDLFNLLLQARIAERDAEQAYMRSIIEYNKAMTDLKFRTGTLLIDNEIYLAEGNWTPGATGIAMQRAEARTFAKDKHKLRTKPIEFVGGAAPGSWESLETNTRPTIPGAMGEVQHPTDGPNQVVPQVPPMNEPQHIVPPVQEELPIPQPVPPTESLPQPQAPAEQRDLQPSRDSITELNRSLRSISHGVQAAPEAVQSGGAGRVRL